jgi:hypothetical protein
MGNPAILMDYPIILMMPRHNGFQFFQCLALGLLYAKKNKKETQQTNGGIDIEGAVL